MNGVIYLAGIGTHSPSKHEYELPPNATRYTTGCGVDNESGNGVIEFIIKQDGKEIWRSGRMEGRMAAFADVSVEGDRRLSLEKDELGSKIFDHADCVNPMVHIK